MKKINNNVKIGEIDGLSERIILLYKQYENQFQDDNFLRGTITEMRILSDKITESLMFSKTESQLAEADEIRDKAVRDLFELVCGLRAVRIEPISVAAKRVYKICNKYGMAMIRKNYDIESAQIDSLLNELSTEESRNDINQMQFVAAVVEDIRQAEDKFKRAVIAYDNSVTQDKKVEPATKIKRQLLDLINNRLMKYLSTMEMLNNGKYLAFNDEVERAIERTNNEVKAHSKNDEDEVSESEENIN